MAAAAGVGDHASAAREVLEADAVAGLDVGAGDRTGRLAGDVERADPLLGGEVSAPLRDLLTDVVAAVDHDQHGRVGQGVGAAHVEVTGVAAPSCGGLPVDPPQPITGGERMDVTEVATVAGAGGLVRAGQPLQPLRQRQRPDRLSRGRDHAFADDRLLGRARRRRVQPEEAVFEPHELLRTRVQQRHAPAEVAGPRTGDHQLACLLRPARCSAGRRSRRAGRLDREVVLELGIAGIRK